MMWEKMQEMSFIISGDHAVWEQDHLPKLGPYLWLMFFILLSLMSGPVL